MASTVNKIKELLGHQKYNNYVVTDIGTFPWCLPGQFNSQGLTLEDKIRDLSAEAKEAYKRYDRWRNSQTQAIQPLFFSRSFTADTFINATKKIKTEAECSNFAYHAIGTLAASHGEPKARASSPW